MKQESLPGIPQVLGTNEFLMRFVGTDSPQERAAFVARYKKDNTKVSPEDLAAIMMTIVAMKKDGSPLLPTSAKLMLGDIFCQHPVPGPEHAQFGQLYNLYAVLYHQCRHKGIYNHLFGTMGMNGSGNEGTKSPIYKALVSPPVSTSAEKIQLVRHDANFATQIHRLYTAAITPGAHVQDLLHLLLYVLRDVADNIFQMNLFKTRSKHVLWDMHKVIELHIDNGVHYGQKHFVALLKGKILVHVE